MDAQAPLRGDRRRRVIPSRAAPLDPGDSLRITKAEAVRGRFFILLSLGAGALAEEDEALAHRRAELEEGCRASPGLAELQAAARADPRRWRRAGRARSADGCVSAEARSVDA